MRGVFQREYISGVMKYPVFILMAALSMTLAIYQFGCSALFKKRVRKFEKPVLGCFRCLKRFLVLCCLIKGFGIINFLVFGRGLVLILIRKIDDLPKKKNGILFTIN